MIEMDMTIDDALDAYPRLANLFVRHHMICVGCGIARFHTLRDAAEMYHLDPEQLRSEIEQVLAGLSGADGSPAPVE
jgi:hybrid cluster-associated redox disulfide protein